MQQSMCDYTLSYSNPFCCRGFGVGFGYLNIFYTGYLDHFGVVHV